MSPTFRRVLLACVFAVATFPSLASAAIMKGGWVEFGSGRYRASGFNGGEFAVYEQNDRSTPLGYTFCIEYYENISLSGTDYFIADISQRAVKGGSESGGGAAPNDGLRGDPISYATDFLFRTFMKGDLSQFGSFGSGFAYNDYWGRRTQEAIWLLEEERTSSQIGESSTARADSVALKDWALANAGTSYSGEVFVLNLFKTNVGVIDADNYNTWKNIYKSRFVQDQLWYNLSETSDDTPEVPEPATMLLWLGLVLSGGAFGIGRKLRFMQLSPGIPSRH